MVAALPFGAFSCQPLACGDASITSSNGDFFMSQNDAEWHDHYHSRGISTSNEGGCQATTSPAARLAGTSISR